MPDQGLSERVAEGLAKLGTALKVRAWHQAEERGLSATQAAILSFLATREGCFSPSTIARALAVSGATVSDSLRALEEKGAISRAPASGDARRSEIRLTSKGRSLARASSKATASLGRLVRLLKHSDQETLLRGLVVIVRALQDEGSIAPSAMCVNCRFFQPFAHPSTEKPHHCDFVDAPFGDSSLQIDCNDFELATEQQRAENLHGLRASPERSEHDLG